MKEFVRKIKTVQKCHIRLSIKMSQTQKEKRYMKKEIIIIILIIFTITVLHIITQKTSGDFFESISEDLTNLEDKILSENPQKEELEKMIEELQDKWKSKYDIHACFIEHDELEKVSTQLISISADIKVQKYDRCVDEIEKCKFILKHIQDKDALKIVNIF
jgi:hypothetical protein